MADTSDSAKSPARAEAFFKDRYGITPRAIESVFGRGLARRTDPADIYFEFTVDESAELENGRVREARRSVGQGAGVRITADDRTGYAHSDDITTENLVAAARTARTITERSTKGVTVAV